MFHRRVDSKTARAYHRLFLPFLVVAALLCSGCAPSTDHAPSPSNGTPSAPNPSTPPAVSAVPASLGKDIAAILEEAGDFRVAVALSDVTGGSTRTFGDESVFVAASTSKILTAAAFYHLVGLAEASLDDTLGERDAGFQIEEMVNSSSNEAWLLLMQAIGYPQLIEYAASIGVVYDPEQNVLAAADMALVLKLLYAGDLLNRADTAQLLGYMLDTNNEELIPGATGPGVEVHHKYGLLGGYLHDAAVISFRQSTSVLVIFTEKTGQADELDQIQLIHDLTRAVERAARVPVG